SRSTYMLAALAPPAAREPPTRVVSTSQPDGRPRAATTMVGTVVTRRSSTMRGLVRARYPRRRARGAAGARVAIEDRQYDDPLICSKVAPSPVRGRPPPSRCVPLEAPP